MYYRWKDPQTLKDVPQDKQAAPEYEAEKRLLELATATGAASASEIERLGFLPPQQGDHVAAVKICWGSADGAEGAFSTMRE